ncbi:hypothetical protein M758_4G152600 [Ceratodon purpureus]|uniref:Secreted protein n=1 Tax=Ceratodon purpureus TaxID=3225 RepID=A0A8T0IB76_CERPU|nr:hypothetical protein KC19_4G151900 [Ceratodon purpureus]KAG0619614.1 hypothetical protein M758_4G152600 [Ceratodon purpureus]
MLFPRQGLVLLFLQMIVDCTEHMCSLYIQYNGFCKLVMLCASIVGCDDCILSAIDSWLQDWRGGSCVLIPWNITS